MKRQKLVEAIQTHLSLMSECTKNEGIDRHMFGLYCIAMENGIELPEIFTDPSYIKRFVIIWKLVIHLFCSC